jgi:amino acid adenylation domain-containing protein
VTLSTAKQQLLQQRLTRGRPEAAAVPRRPAGAAPPLSYAQERLWFMEQFAPGTAAYGSPIQLRFGPDLDLDIFAAALGDLVARHESLRMRYPSTDDGRPTVVVDPPAPVSLPVIEVDDPDPALVELASRPFDLAAGPVLRAAALRYRDGYAILIDLHHIATDGWSNEIVVSDLMELHRARLAGEPPNLPAGRIDYGDFAAWQREWMAGEVAAAGVQYWVQRLRAVPALELPTDAPRPATQTFDGASHRFSLDAELVTALTALGREHNATPFMTLLAGWQALLSRYTGQTDFAVGSPVAGRARPELDGVVGMFVNMLPLRAELSGDPTVAEFLERTRNAALEALARQDIPFEKVVTDLNLVRDVSRSPLFQTMLVLQNYVMPSNSDRTHGWQAIDVPATRFDLEWHAYGGADGSLRCRLVYNTVLFEPATIQRLASHLPTLLADMVARPQARISELALMDAAEHARIDGWNATGEPVAPTTLNDLIAAQASQTPSAVAVVDERTQLSYAELSAMADRIARRLRAHGVGAGSMVAIGAHRSVELVAGLIGILRAGAAYVPLDPDYPPDRLAYMLSDCAAPVLLTQSHLVDRMPSSGAAVLLLDDTDSWTEPPAGTADAPPASGLGPTDAAYMIYTSGSTGRPKGVVNEHRGIVNRLHWMQAAHRLGPGDVVLQKTPASFDVSVWEFFWPLITGARLVLARPGGHRDPAYLREVIAAHRVTTVHFVPSMLAAFLADGEPADITAGCASLRRIICSGEELPVALARRALEAMPAAGLHNLYGPTEAAVDVTAFACTPASLAGRARVPIGAPMANVTIEILDPRGRRVPIGAAGELFIGGVQVARGYFQRPELTAQRFLVTVDGKRRYATGDLARWGADGNIEFLGRADGQVKLRGLRIELGEIEAALRDQTGVREAAAAVKEVNPGDRRIVGYVVGAADADTLRTALARRLPDYMVPSAFVTVDALPLSPSGKLDRGALPVPEPAGRGGGELVAPRTDAERAIAAIWGEVLGLDQVGVHDDFFALGGHSLLATQVVAKMRRLTDTTGRRIGVMDLFQHPTVAGLAGLLSVAETGPRHLLYELTRPPATVVRSYVCIPYGGGPAVVYQPIADALPPGHRLFSLAMPGHDVGLDEDSLPFAELARRGTEEVLNRVDGPLVLYGHCGVGGALIIELARRLEAAGRHIEAVYAGGIFPFARPRGALSRFHAWTERMASNRVHANWLKSMGVDTDDIGPAEADRVIANMRRDGDAAEDFFTDLLDSGAQRLRAPVISVVGERDPITDYYQERYREWRALTDTAAVVVLAEAGHFFLRYRAAELVDIITRTHDAIARGEAGQLSAREGSWWLHGVARAGDAADPGRPADSSMRRFLTVASGQLVSTAGSAMTAFAIPIWVLRHTGSLTYFGLLAALAFAPNVLTTPLAGALADRYDRRKVIMIASLAAAGAEALFGGVLWLRGDVPLAAVYLLVIAIATAGAFQRITFIAAIPQLAPKRFLGHANGVAQLITGAATLFAPLLAAGLYVAIDLRGILAVDLLSYGFAVTVLAVVRFPDLMGRRRRETFNQQLLGGLRLSWNNRHFRAMLVFFGVGNLLFAVPTLMVTPLVLAFGSLNDVGRVAFIEALGAVAGGLAMTIWGGPRRHKMAVNLASIALAGVFAALTGLRPNLAVVAVGVFGTAAALGVANGIYLTVIQTKVPQRFHGRVFALNQTLAWSTLPVGFAALPPLIDRYAEPLLAPGGGLAGSVGTVLGTGPGRGIGLAFVVFGLLMTVNAVVGLGIRRLARLDSDLPDALPDDLVGQQELARTAGGNR